MNSQSRVQRKMEDMYTEDEYILLRDILVSAGLDLSNTIASHINESNYYWADSTGAFHTEHSLCAYMEHQMPFAYKVMFTVPLEDTPLLINFKDPNVSMILKWRWSIGK